MNTAFPGKEGNDYERSEWRGRGRLVVPSRASCTPKPAHSKAFMLVTECSTPKGSGVSATLKSPLQKNCG